MNETERRGSFVRILKSAKTTQKEKQDLLNFEQMSERLIWYEDVEYIRKSLKQKNFVDYFIIDEPKSANREGFELYIKESSITKLLDEQLPGFFVQINRSEVINMMFIIGRSELHIFTKNRMIKFGKTFKKEANSRINLFFDSSRAVM